MRTHKYSNLQHFDIINLYNSLINNVKNLFHFLKNLLVIKIEKITFIINMLQYFYKIYVIYIKNFATMHTVYFYTHHKYINIIKKLPDIKAA